MKAEPCQDRVHARRGNAFWVVRNGSAPARPFVVVLPDGREAMALFGSEDEARVFCQFGEEGADLRVRETSTGEVHSLLICPWCAKHLVVGTGKWRQGSGLIAAAATGKSYLKVSWVFTPSSFEKRNVHLPLW